MFAIILGVRNFLEYPAFAQVQVDTLLSQIPPKPPRTQRTSPTTPAGGPHRTRLPQIGYDGEVNYRKPVEGGFNSPNLYCKSSSKSLTALIPIGGRVLTTRQHPTFLFYIPYAPDDVRVGEFSLLVNTPKEKPQFYKTRFTVLQTPGIVSITLPSKPEYALEEGEVYTWYFDLYCQSNTSSEPDLEVSGGVQRVALTPERERQINRATPAIWYDASANLAESLRTSPQDAKLRNDWVNLLKSIGLEDLAQEPLAGSVIPPQPMLTPIRKSYR
jgi:hypothetical protein